MSLSRLLPWLIVGCFVAVALVLVFRTEKEPMSVEALLDGIFASSRKSVFQPVVATVNGAPISGERVQLGVAFNRLTSLGLTPRSPVSRVDPWTTLDFLIAQEVTYQEAARRGLLCSDEERNQMALEQMNLHDRPDVIRDEGADAYAKAWARHLGVSVDMLVEQPVVIYLYERQCSSVNLVKDLIEGTGFRTFDPEGLAIWKDFRQSLVASADIEILDPALQ